MLKQNNTFNQALLTNKERYCCQKTKQLSQANNVFSYTANWSSEIYFLKIVLADGTEKKLKIEKQ